MPGLGQTDQPCLKAPEQIGRQSEPRQPRRSDPASAGAAPLSPALSRGSPCTRVLPAPARLAMAPQPQPPPCFIGSLKQGDLQWLQRGETIPRENSFHLEMSWRHPSPLQKLLWRAARRCYRRGFLQRDCYINGWWGSPFDRLPPLCFQALRKARAFPSPRTGGDGALRPTEPGGGTSA